MMTKINAALSQSIALLDLIQNIGVKVEKFKVLVRVCDSVCYCAVSGEQAEGNLYKSHNGN